eukprot:3935711-Rhodomonas_salina.5
MSGSWMSVDYDDVDAMPPWSPPVNPLPPTQPFPIRRRSLCGAAAGEQWLFQRSVLAVILLSCVLLALEPPAPDIRGVVANETLKVVSDVTTICFLVEFLVKVTAFGFLRGDKAYLKSGSRPLHAPCSRVVSATHMLRALQMESDGPHRPRPLPLRHVPLRGLPRRCPLPPPRTVPAPLPPYASARLCPVLIRVCCYAVLRYGMLLRGTEEGMLLHCTEAGHAGTRCLKPLRLMRSNP